MKQNVVAMSLHLDGNILHTLLETNLLAIDLYNQKNTYMRFSERVSLLGVYDVIVGDNERLAIIHHRDNIMETEYEKQFAPIESFYLTIIEKEHISFSGIVDVASYDVKEMMFITSYYKEHPECLITTIRQYCPGTRITKHPI